jgi:hypothetical protein
VLKVRGEILEDIYRVYGRCGVVLLGIVFISSFIFIPTIEILAGFTPTPSPGPTSTLTPAPTPVQTATPQSTPTRKSPDDGPTLTPAPKTGLTPTPVMLLPESGKSLGKVAGGGLVGLGMLLTIVGVAVRRAFSRV